MTIRFRSSVLRVVCLLLPTTASAQSPPVPAAARATPAAEVSVQDARWVPAAHGTIPAGAIAHGRERDGRPQYICRATVNGGLHLGKVSPGSAGCVLVMQGRAAVRDSYHVLTELYTPQDEAVPSQGRRSRWGRSESVVDLIRRRHAESGVAKESLDH
jgi:hypothetical protein